MLSDEGSGLVYCRGDAVESSQVFAEFRRTHGPDCAKLADGAKVLTVCDEAGEYLTVAVADSSGRWRL